MASSERADLTVVATLKDQLSGPLAAAKGNVGEFEKSIGRIDATSKAAGTSLGGLGASLGSIAKAGVLAFGAFQAFDLAGNFFAGAIQGAQEEEQGIARLTASLKANDAAFTGNLATIEKTIAAREELAFSDDELRSSLGTLVAATHDTNKALEIQATAMDLARFKGISLQEASQALTRIEGGRFRALADLGIQLKANATQEEALAAVQRVSAGQAEAFANTTQGSMQAAAIAVHDLQEEIGKELAPAIKDAATFIRTDLVPALRDATNIARDAAPIFKAVAESMGLIARGPTDDVKKAAEVYADLLKVGRDTSGFWDESAKAAAQAAQAYDAAHQGADDATNSIGDLNTVLARGGGLFGDFAANAEHGVEAVDDVQLALDGLPRDISINIDVGLSGAGAGLLAVGFPTTPTTPAGNTDFTPLAGSSASLSGTDADPAVVARKAEEARRKAQEAADKAAREAKQRAEELARAYHDKVNVEFENAKRIADTLFDALHRRHLQAIKDAEDLAQKKHDAAVAEIADNLKLEQAAHAAPVTAAENALRQREQEQQRRDLVKAQQAAQQALDTNRDPTRTADLQDALLHATEALQNFDAQAVIDRLKVAQAAQDAASEQRANAATKAADAELAAAKEKAKAETDAETIAAQKRKDDFEKQLEALKKRDEAAGKTPSQIQKDIDALEKRFGITTDALGFHHINDPLVTAIKNIKIEPPQVNINAPISAILQLPTAQVKLIASAIVTAAQPSATSGTRSGNR